MRPRRGVQVQLYSFFKLGVRWVGSQNHDPPGLLYPLKDKRYPLYRKLSGRQGLSGWVQKISPQTRIRSPDRPEGSESLYRLNYPGPLWVIRARRNREKSEKDTNNDFVSSFILFSSLPSSTLACLLLGFYTILFFFFTLRHFSSSWSCSPIYETW